MSEPNADGRLAVFIDLSVTTEEMSEWPSQNVSGYFEGIADAYGHMVAARQAIAKSRAAKSHARQSVVPFSASDRSNG